ncbi:hypothetical protein [Paenibacillus sp. HB172176]|uniref:hypothetical protein n=1 Tax=Paenibacillus sp. HB172176 TaxID=2493690 RepID=UPI00143976F6|nr:hypothetical protein [Paenibacillus sp. HB172176]
MGKEEQLRHEEAENELLSIYLMGDIREDAQFLGLTLKDIGWIIGTTLIIGLVPFLLPVSFWTKLIWLVLVSGFSFIGRMVGLPMHRKRYYLDKRYQPKRGSGSDMGALLGMQEDGWYYVNANKNGKPVVQILYQLQAPPWETAILSQKRKRIAAFGQFIRACAKEGFAADIHAEQIPDFRHDIWQQKEASSSDSEGIHNLKMMRIGMWRELARSGEAQRSAYVLRLSIDQHRIDARQRDDEPEGTKEELKRFRFSAELRERQSRVMAVLAQSGHAYSLISGYVTPELLGRWWDRKAWEQWTDAQESWEEPETEEKSEHYSETETSNLAPEEATADVDEIEQQVVDEIDQPTGDERKRSFLRLLASHCTALWAILSRLQAILVLCFWKRKEPTTHELEPAVEDESVQDENESLVLTPGIRFLTSPVPSGKTFLSVNLGAAWSSHVSPVHVIDLSPDQGCKTALNPLPLTCDEEGWEAYMSRHTPGLTLWIPKPGQRDAQAVQRLLRKLGEAYPVLVDVPWGYPGREELLEHGNAIAVVDNDYHHWLRWAQASPTWQGEVWINNVDSNMEQAVETLVKEQWQLAISYVCPAIPGARNWLYQGRPPATDGAVRGRLRQSETSQEEEGCA